MSRSVRCVEQTQCLFCHRLHLLVMYINIIAEVVSPLCRDEHIAFCPVVPSGCNSFSVVYSTASSTRKRTISASSYIFQVPSILYLLLGSQPIIVKNNIHASVMDICRETRFCSFFLEQLISQQNSYPG